MTYVDAHVLARDALAEVIAPFPASVYKVRRATILLALRRHLTHAAREVYKRRKLRRETNDFLDHAHAATPDVSHAARHKNEAQRMAVELQALSTGAAGALAEGAALSAAPPPAAAALTSDVHEDVKHLRAQMERLQETVELLVQHVHSQSSGSGATDKARPRPPRCSPLLRPQREALPGGDQLGSGDACISTAAHEAHNDDAALTTS